jgi:hypothetical protein
MIAGEMMKQYRVMLHVFCDTVVHIVLAQEPGASGLLQQ